MWPQLHWPLGMCLNWYTICVSASCTPWSLNDTGPCVASWIDVYIAYCNSKLYTTYGDAVKRGSFDFIEDDVGKSIIGVGKILDSKRSINSVHFCQLLVQLGICIWVNFCRHVISPSIVSDFPTVSCFQHTFYGAIKGICQCPRCVVTVLSIL